VSSSPDSLATGNLVPRQAADAPSSDPELPSILHAALGHRAGELAARWTAQAAGILLLEQPPSDGPAHGVDARGLVEALIESLDPAGRSRDVIDRGVRFGGGAFAARVSLHHTIKALDLLVAMVLYAAEETARGSAAVSASAADGIRVTRELQRGASLLVLSAVRGYTQAYGDHLRECFRHLRHDLRNPLGTIKSVLALMDDESVPMEARVNPSFRAMAARNARSLEEMITDRLADAAVPVPVALDEDVSVRAIALAVRRDLRWEAQRRGVEVIVDDDDVRGRLDASGLELLLRSALQAVVDGATRGERVEVRLRQDANARVAIHACRASGRPSLADAGAIDRLAALAKTIGASVTLADCLIVLVPLQGPASRAAAVRGDAHRRGTTGSDGGQAPHDLGGASQSDHGQAGAL
jgi:signal transduction histidine kinase